MSTLLGRWTFILLCALCWLKGSLAALRPLLLLPLALNPGHVCSLTMSVSWEQFGRVASGTSNTQQPFLLWILISRTPRHLAQLGSRVYCSISQGIYACFFSPSLSWSLRTGKLALTHQVCLCPELLHSPGFEFQNSKAFSALYRKSLPFNWACGADPKWQKGQVKNNRNIRGMKPPVNIAQYSLTPTLPSLFLHLRPCE